MTLIAVIPCESGFLFAADTREVIADVLIQSVRKLVQIPFGTEQGSVVYGGAGDGDLLDEFEETLRRALQKSAPSTVSEVGEICEKAFGKFHRAEIRPRPDDPVVLPVFGAALPRVKECGAWLIRKQLLRPITSWELVGTDFVFYKRELRRVLPANATVAQATLTALHVFGLAGDTATVIGRDPDVFFVDKRGVWAENPVHIRSMQARLTEYERSLNTVFVSCVDTGLPTVDLKKQLEAFEQSALALHAEQINVTARDLFAVGVDLVNDPYPRIPTGSMISMGFDGISVIEPDQLEPGDVPIAVEI
jgi:hypothetical protein